MELSVGKVKAKPGEKKSGSLKAIEMPNGSVIQIPFILINGVEKGPILYSQVAAHGMEINGVEVIRRLVTKLEPNDLSGGLILVPVANTFAFAMKQSVVPEILRPGYNMNRVWPGKSDGTIHERMAYVLWENCIKKANYLIDNHTGGTGMLTHVVFMHEDPKARELAINYGCEYIISEKTGREEKEAGTGRADWEKERFFAKLRVAAGDEGIPGITPELDGHSRFDENAITIGLRGFTNVMKYLNMLDNKPELPKKQLILENHLGRTKAKRSGLFRAEIEPGIYVKKGDIIGRIYSIWDIFKEVEVVEAPIDGFCYSIADNPVVYEGDSLASVLRVIEEINN
jgi:predicted deacylase